MKKIFSLLAAVLYAGAMMAESISITPDLLKSSYQEGTFAVGEVTFSYSGAMYNGKNQPNGFAAKQFIQLRKSSSGAGEIKNSTALNLKSITVATQNDKDFTLSAGTEASALSAVTKPAGTTASYACKDNNNGDTQTNVTLYTFNVEGNSYFDILNGSNASYIAYITIELSEGGEVPPTPACDWDNIAYAGNGSGNAANTDRYKVCLGTPAPNFVNIQAPGWATEAGFYFEFPSAAWGSISLEEGEYQIQGAGIILFASAFMYDAEKEVTIVCQDVEYTITIQNNNPEVAPVEPITCLDVYQMAKNDVVDLLNDVVVTYANGKNVWVRDETASMLIYLSANTTWQAGDVLSSVAGVVDVYNGIHEVKPSADQVAAVTATAGEVPAAEEVASVAASDVNKYIVMKNVEAEGAFTEGSQSNITINGVAVRNQFKNGYTFESGKHYNIYGVVTLYQNNPQVYFISATEYDPTAIENTDAAVKATKVIENGQLFIIKNGVRYDAQGTMVK